MGSDWLVEDSSYPKPTHPLTHTENKIIGSAAVPLTGFVQSTVYWRGAFLYITVYLPRNSTEMFRLVQLTYSGDTYDIRCNALENYD